MDGPPSELNSWLRSWMKVRGPRKVTVSMLGWTEVLAPVFESKVNELKVIPMNECGAAEQHELEIGQLAVDRIGGLGRVGDRRVNLGGDEQVGGHAPGVGLEEPGRVGFHRRGPAELGVDGRWGLGVVVAGVDEIARDLGCLVRWPPARRGRLR